MSIFCQRSTFKTGFNWSDANYAPLVNIGVFVVVGLWWLLGAKRSFKGPVRTVDDPTVQDVGGAAAAASA